MMEAIALYLVKSVVWITGFLAVYFLFLRNERFFRINRMFLITGIIASFLLPLLTISYSADIPAPVDIQTGKAEVLSAIPSGEGWFPGINMVLITLYLLGATIVTVLFAIKSRAVIRSVRKAEVISETPVKVLRTDDYTSSFSFFSWIFVNPSVTDIEAREIMNHEMVHIRQKHWADLLLGEVLCVLQWFNPLSWVYIHFIRETHEFLADEGALQRSADPAIYRAALLNQVIGLPVFSLSNSFNYSLTKKRFKMMKNIVTSPYRKMRILLILPVMAAILAAFAKPEYKYTVNNDPSGISQTASFQDKVVKGVVLFQSGAPMSGASVVAKGTTIGTTTDSKGYFALGKIPADGALVVSYIGYSSKVVKPDYSGTMNITMVRDTVRIGTVRTAPLPPPPPPPPPPAEQGKTNPKSDKEVYVMVEEMPSFPGGDQALRYWIGANVKYPAEAVKKGTMGQVLVIFEVTEIGSVMHVKVDKSVDPALDAEAVRVVSAMPAWTPGRQNGKPVGVIMKIPIDFKLN